MASPTFWGPQQPTGFIDLRVTQAYWWPPTYLEPHHPSPDQLSGVLNNLTGSPTDLLCSSMTYRRLAQSTRVSDADDRLFI